MHKFNYTLTDPIGQTVTDEIRKITHDKHKGNNMKIIQIGYWAKLVVHEHTLPQWVDLLNNASTENDKKELTAVEYEIKNAPDYEYEALKSKAAEEVKDSIGKERDQFRTWWTQSNSERDAAKKELSELKKKFSDLERLVNGESGESI
jgi:uncharacterized protein (DUF3084 family)